MTTTEFISLAKTNNWTRKQTKGEIFKLGGEELWAKRDEILSVLGLEPASQPAAITQPVAKKQETGPFFCCAFRGDDCDFYTTDLQSFAEKLAEIVADRGGDVKFATHILAKRTAAWRADCDQFDDSSTGYHSRESRAKAAFWSENTFSNGERARVCVYTRKDEIGPDEVIGALHMAFSGYDSPALGIDALA